MAPPEAAPEARAEPAAATTEAPPAKPAAGPSAGDPPFTPGTSLPGAIPPSPPPQPASQAAAPADPAQWLRERETRRADYQKRVAEAEAAAVQADASVATWERNLLAFKNPLLPRPQLGPEDTAAIAGMDGVQRVAWAETKLADARTARDAAKKALEQLKANPPLN